MKNLIALLLLLAVYGAVLAGPFEDGVAAYESGDYATALRLNRSLAEQGQSTAQYNLGFMYDKGLGVPQDDAQAVTWYRKAAEQGLPLAQGNLGFMYDEGQGVPQDDAQAVTWYRKAAEQGYPTAQYDLGIMYGKGRGVPQDYVEAHKWANLAAASATDAETRDKATHNRDLIASKMTPAQIAEAQKLARDWKPNTPTK